MYTRNFQGWSKHFDFLIIDTISLQIAYVLAVYLRLGYWAYTQPAYRNLGIILALSDLVVLAFNNSMHNVLRRGYYKEAIATLKHCLFVIAIAAIYMFASQSGDIYSRLSLLYTFLFHLLIGYGLRVLWKLFVQKHYREKVNKRSMLVVSTPENAESLLTKLENDEIPDYQIVGVVLTQNIDQAKVQQHPIVASLENAADYICREWIDSVYFDTSLDNPAVNALMDACIQMAIPVHYHIPNMSRAGITRFSEKIGGTTVLTTSINYATPMQVVAKRLLDIVGGLFGSLLALVIIAIVGPKIKKASPGPVLFKQERIGKNGKRFKIYKLRSMYPDADARKKEFMEQNRVKDGMMFKLDFDPRIIGNEILPDGTQKTGIGDFIRRTSLDEFPQFFNALKGDMSLVGTRPPTPDEWEKYEFHHRARLGIKPGITGMWQISGRSDITDFEEVVKLDTEYIRNWSPGLDLRILFCTFRVILTGKGAI